LVEPRVLAELNVRHTRRHQPTRRVALGDAFVPVGGPAYGAVLLGALVAECFDDLDDDQAEQLPALLADARRGPLRVPRIALRFRLQTDTHALDRSRHRIVAETDAVVLELDRHGRGAPQLVAAVAALAALDDQARRVAFRAVDAARAAPGKMPEGLRVRRLWEGVAGAVPLAGTILRSGDVGGSWDGVPSERRWAMEVLGFRAGAAVTRTEVQRRFRRLVRAAHPDHGAAAVRAAEQLAELAAARAVLLAFASPAARIDG
jgi:hypothetical protein